MNILALGFVLITSFTLCLALERMPFSRRRPGPNSYRRKPNESTPLMGGLAIVLATFVGGALTPTSIPLLILIPTLALVGVGLLDDRFEISGKTKFFVQLMVSASTAGILNHQSFLVQWAGPWVGGVLTCAFLIGLMNAWNLIDGLDGLAGLTAAIASLSLLSAGEPTGLSLILALATTGFLLRNFKPARIYMGESGSSFLGFSLGVMALLLPQTNPSGWTHFMAILFLFSVPFTDTVSAMVRRYRKRVSILSGDREHIHHRMIKLRFTEWQTLGLTSLLVLAGGATFALSLKLTTPQAWWLFAISSGLMTTLFFGVFTLERRFGQHLLSINSQLVMHHLVNPMNASRSTHLSLVAERGILVDLLPYFRELQGLGMIQITTFLSDLGKWVRNHSSATQVYPYGSYSFVVTMTEGKTWSPDEIQVLSQELYSILARHHVVRGTTPVPEGVSFLNLTELSALGLAARPTSPIEKMAV